MAKQALVLGCGASGIASAEYLAREGWVVTVADTREAPEGVSALKSRVPSARFIGGAMAESLVLGKNLLVVSPGLSPEHSAAAPVVVAARKTGIEVVGEIELFARYLVLLKKKRGYAPKIIAVTGTNGKTTTTTIVGLMVEKGGFSVGVAGNIGPNAVTELMKADVEGRLPEYWVLELSSFQLETTESLCPVSAAFLNLTQDHIDWHGSMSAYGSAKARIFSENSVRVLNRDDGETLKCATGDARTQTFGDSAPAMPGEWGISVQDGKEFLSRFSEHKTAPECFLEVSALKIRGRHNAMNALAATALATSAGVPLEACVEVLRTYCGEAHRVQSVLVHDGVDFIDDSKGTNVGATVAALEGLGKSGVKSSLILGGDGKGQDFSPIATAVRTYARHVVLIGRDAPLIAEAIGGCGVPVQSAGMDFEKAVDLAYAAAKAGDAVLLSPACASWDMFKNYAERSARFVARAKALVGV